MTMTEEQLRVKSYLTAQAAKLAPAAIVQKVRDAMAELESAAAAVPAARFTERPEAEEWSGDEVMAHVLAASAHFGSGITSAIDAVAQPAGGRAAADAARPAKPAEEWSRALAAQREALFARVLAADPDGRLDRVIEHRMFGPLNWREALLFMRLHDLDHAGQLKKITAAFGAGGR